MERGAAPAGVARNHALGRLRASCRAALGPLREVLAGRGPTRPPGGQGATTVRSGTGAEVKGRKRRNPEARPGAAAERELRQKSRGGAPKGAAGRRHRLAISGDPGIGPTARRVTGAALPHQRRSALCPPQLMRGTPDDGVPRAAKNRGGGALAKCGWRVRSAISWPKAAPGERT